jgi:lipopolysaccharide biosynthesis glycosyltransferase
MLPGKGASLIAKKNLAILFGITPDYSFALANVLAGLREHSPDLADDIIVHHDGISAAEQARLNAILPCTFRHYEPPVALSDHRLSKFAFSRFEAFGLLREYRYVLWLDVDILIRGDLSGILDYCGTGMGACFEPAPLSELFPESFCGQDELSACDFSTPYFNTGVLLLSDALENPSEKMDWLYSLAERYSDAFAISADQGAINLMTRVFGQRVSPLPGTFNSMICNDWHPAYQPKRGAKVIHSITEDKFWNYWFFREWDARYRQWLDAGGTPAGNYLSPHRRPWLSHLARKARFYRKCTSRFRHPVRLLGKGAA